MIMYKQLILIGVVLFVIIVASNNSYFNTINNLYRSFSKIPRLLFIAVGILSLFGVNNLIDKSHINKYKVNERKTLKKILPNPEENGKRLVSDTTKKFIAAKQKWSCGMCGKMLDETFEVDHVIPLYKCGSNDIDNLMALDPICHRKKTNADRLNLAANIFTV